MFGLEPVEDVGFAAHRADFDDLLETEKRGWDAAIDGVSQGGIVLVKSLY